MSPTTRMRVLAAAVRSWRTRDAVSWPCFIAVLEWSAKESGEWTGWAGPWLFGGQSDFVGGAARFDGHFKSDGDSVGVACDRNCGVDEDGIRPHFHGFGSMAGRTEAGVDDDG